MNEIVSVKVDYIFKLLFGDERNIDILSGFLSAVLGIDEFEDIQLLDPMLKREHEDDKLGILDVNLRASGKLINIEIQVMNKRDFEKRSVYYTGKRLVEQLGKGDSYMKLNQTISINIIDFDLFRFNKYHSTFWFIEEQEHERLTDIVRIDFLELKKAKKTQQKQDIKQSWMNLINAEKEDDLAMIPDQNGALKRAAAELIRLSSDDTVRAEYEARQKALRDRMAEIAYGVEQGKAEGRLEGRTEGKAEGIKEVAKRLHSIGIPLDKISQATSLAPDTLKKLLNLD